MSKTHIIKGLISAITRKKGNANLTIEAWEQDIKTSDWLEK